MRESVTGGRCQHRSVEEGIDGAMAKALCPLRVLARVRNPIYAAAPGRVNRVKSERKIDGSGKRRWEMTAAAPLGSGADSARLGSAAAPPPPSQAGTSTGRWVNRENVTLGVAGEPQLHVGKPGNGAGRNPSVGEGRAERGSRAARPRVPGGRSNPLSRAGRRGMGTQICVPHLILVQEVLCQLMEGQNQSWVPLQAPPACGKQSWDLSIPSSRVPGGNSGRGGAGESKEGWSRGAQLCRGGTMSCAEMRRQHGTRINPQGLMLEIQRRWRRWG